MSSENSTRPTCGTPEESHVRRIHRTAPADDRIRLGVLTNPAAQHNFRFPFTHRRLRRRLASAADAVATADKTQIDEAIRHLLVERGVNVLAINGGDGTIHCAVNTIVAHQGPDVMAGRSRFPILLFLNGGTYNMASRAMGTKDDPVSTLTGFLDCYRERPLTEVPTRTLGLLEVERNDKPSMLGMVFGSEVIANALELCDQLGSGYLGLARLLLQGTLGYVIRTDFFRSNAWRLRPTNPRTQVNGQFCNDVTGAVASTIDLKLARGMVWALTTSAEVGGFHVKLVRAKAPGEVVRLLPYLLWEFQHTMVPSFPNAKSLVTSGNFTVDGELFKHTGTLEVSPSPHRLQVVAGESLRV